MLRGDGDSVGGMRSMVYMHPAGSVDRQRFATSADHYAMRQMRGQYRATRRVLGGVLHRNDARRAARFAAIAVLLIDWQDARPRHSNGAE